MASRYGSSHAHDHEWHIVEDDTAIIFDDDALHVYEECEYAESRSVGTSKRHDETFYETTYKCEQLRAHRFDITKVVQLYDDANGGITIAEVGNQSKTDGQTVTDSEGVGKGDMALLSLNDDNRELAEMIAERCYNRLTGANGDSPEALEYVCGRYEVYDDPFSIVVSPYGVEYDYRIHFEPSGTEMQ